MSGCLDFTITGVACIDNIIHTLEEASSGYHSTEYWNDTDEFEPLSYVEKLQRAFNEAARTFKTLEESDETV